jgi:Asp-tRNA(Asn)/Glu-tRNA(Gln) amidotransferase A subunit family amidase
MPVGINITGRVREDDVVLNIANYVEKVTGLKDIYSKVGDIDV